MDISNSKSKKRRDRSSTGPYNASWESWSPAEKRALYREATRSLQASDRLLDFAAARRLVGGREFDLAGHEYLRGIYDDESPMMVIRKAAQMGASEYAITRALHFAITRGGGVMYFFPSDRDVADFSRDRFAPALEQNPYLAGLVRDTNTIGLKRIGKGSVYLRGTNSTVRMKSVPADFLIFDELDEMEAAKIELARKRLGHSTYGWELALSTPSFPGYGIDATFLESDQRFWLLKCPSCTTYACLEDLFLEHHGSPQDPRSEICFIKGPAGAEELVCLKCGHRLDPLQGVWAGKYDRPSHGYHLSKFASVIVSERERKDGAQTKPAALLAEWRKTPYPAEFFHSELGLPYLAADGGLTEQELRALVGDYGQQARGRECVMGVDQGNGLYIVIKEVRPNTDIIRTVRVHHEPVTDSSFSHLDRFMEAFDVRACVIDAQPNVHAARAFAQRYRDRVTLAYYIGAQKGLVQWSHDREGSPIANISRTEALDLWRDMYQKQNRRVPRIEDEVSEYVRQMTNILRTVREDPHTGEKRASWIQRGPDHYAHADWYAEIALKRLRRGQWKVTVIG